MYGALGRAIDRFERTVFELSANKPTLIEWANSQETLQDEADRRELRLGSAHVFQQSIELLQGMQMMTDREEDPARLSAIHHLSLIHISEPTRLGMISYAVFCLKKKKTL